MTGLRRGNNALSGPGVINAGMENRCRACRARLAHCHGTLIRHPTLRAECTEADCTSPELVLHTLVIDCDAVGCACADQPDHALAV